LLEEGFGGNLFPPFFGFGPQGQGFKKKRRNWGRRCFNQFLIKGGYGFFLPKGKLLWGFGLELKGGPSF